MLSLQRIDGRNVWDILKLKVSKEQQSYVAGNDVSLIEAYISKTENGQIFPFGIYKDDVPVGFLMIGFGTDSSWDDAPAIAQNNYDLRRLMIDIKYQGRGYGKEALNLALEFIHTFPCGKAEYCWLSYEPENKVARDLYRSFGFVETGEKDGEELIAVLKLVSDVSEVSSTKELLDNGAVFSSDNEELLAQFFQAENMRDWETYETFLAKDVVWELREAGQTKIIKGKCAYMNCIRSAYRGSNATFSCEGLYTGADNSCLAAMLVSDAGTRSCDMFWFEDGKIVFELEVILG
ncbi:GNAT family N-acetyltransferase [Lancefieldella parvula]|uniref:GCN5-related N-acetyltransferase n=1 Tax=Lancefieldella parvula (strain ATCC 33793 / DSM 20469 / CCUG 32760 / JCM 10300 / KCTC 3663 / VPI 0546 / 1246) TaxID=521095 RepID=C8W805_LANP1|nr:GNAT family N-acetyltransferase [Lancefieldella parvula]ACV51595.1 GCN5-related N-acetyltransferase [Lancefieldella parvula DSM 20469]